MAKIKRTINIEERVWKEAQANVENEKPKESLSRKIEYFLIHYNLACQTVKEQEEKK